MKRKLCLGLLYLCLCVAMASIVVCSIYLYWNFEYSAVTYIHKQSIVTDECDKVFNGIVIDILKPINKVLIELTDDTDLVIGMDLDNRQLRIGEHVELYKDCVYSCLDKLTAYYYNDDEYYWEAPFSANDCTAGEAMRGLLILTGILMSIGMCVSGIMFLLIMLTIIVLKIYVNPWLKRKVIEMENGYKKLATKDCESNACKTI